MSSYRYDSSFMDSASRSRLSADRIVSLILDRLQLESVIDFGCARGTWLAAWKDCGISDVTGVDGDYLDGEPLEIEKQKIVFRDLSRPIDIGRRYDLAQSLEVAEHLSPESGPTFVESLTKHSDMVLFSASPPGQGGENHLNERPYGYWRDQFARHDYAMLDWIRPLILGDTEIRYWYRYNVFMFVAQRLVKSLPNDLAASAVEADRPPRDLSPQIFKLRKMLVRRLPVGVQTRIARAMARL